MRLNSAPKYILFLGLLSGCAAQVKPSTSDEMDKAQERFVAGDWVDAAQRFDRLADKHKRVDFFLSAAEAYRRLEQNKASEARLAAAARLAPTDNRVLIAVSRMIKIETSKDKTKASKENLNAASFWSGRAREQVQKSNIASALSDLEVATGIDRNRLQDWVLLGHLARTMGRHSLASQAHYQAYTLLDREPFRSHSKAAALQQKMLTSVLALTAFTNEHETAAAVLEKNLLTKIELLETEVFCLVLVFCLLAASECPNRLNLERQFCVWHHERVIVANSMASTDVSVASNFSAPRAQL